MNLKEIGVLLTGLYVVTLILISYKYYKAKGGVFQLSNFLLVKYSLRFVTLISLLFICFNTIEFNRLDQKQTEHKVRTLIAISNNNSSLTWNNIHDKVAEYSSNGEFGLIMFEPSNNKWVQIIPLTNQDSFLNLIEHGQAIRFGPSKIIFSDNIRYKASKDQFALLNQVKTGWIVNNSTSNESLSLSKFDFISWIQTSNVPLYFVILIVFLSFFDIIFPINALKI
jgi:hypothetical protein